jgi:hypothetical protein
MPSRSFVASFLVSVVAVAASGLLVHAAQNGGSVSGAEAKRKDIETKVSELIKQLGDDSYQAREAAAKSLAAIGEPALKLLEKAALESKDTEVQVRADALALQITQPQRNARQRQPVLHG